MAASVPDQSVVNTHRDDFLTCGICLEVFKDPRILPCLHTFCFKCISTCMESRQSGNSPALCPKCQEPFPEETNCFNQNVFISGLTRLVEFKAVKKDECTPCGLHNSVSPALRRCLDCGDYLCSSCSGGHTASSLTLHHQTVPLIEIRQGKYDAKLRQLQKIPCQHHKEKDVVYLCQSCCQPACISCVVIGHKGHTIQPIAEAANQLQSTMKCLVETIREDMTTIKVQEQNILSLVKAGKAKKEAKKRLIEDNAQQEIAVINARKCELLKKVNDEWTFAVKEQESKLEKVVRQKAVASSCVDFCVRILEKGKDYEVLMLETVIIERLQTIQSLLPVTRPNQAEQEEHCQVVSQIGSPKGGKSSDVVLTRGTSQKSIYTTPALRSVFSGKSKLDMKKPDINDMTYSSRIGLILSDKANKKLKVLNTRGDLQREIIFEGFNPFAVSAAGDEIGAISGNYLWLITASGCLKNTIQVDKKKPDESQCFTYCLAASERVGYVVGNIHGVNGLYLYNLDGTQRTFVNFQVHFPLAALSLSPSADIILSEWGSGSVTILSVKGILRWRGSSPGWKPNGTCVVEDGTVFVADYNWGGLRAYNESGESVLQYRTTSDGLKNPKCLVTTDKGLLCVAGKDRVCVYDIQRK
ncbi:E3 ubiquitin-protein ligase TRIM56-like isoform X2 [Haliotis cracherodii]|uniref:E3 ubiquitin-protein ligase TRIM56-like isoform X2 n=1 Tax=Haliotis cracherodii TaxID=6455 RepID=UPI0039ED9A77